MTKKIPETFKKTFFLIFFLTTISSYLNTLLAAPNTSDLQRNEENLNKNLILPKKIPESLLKKTEIIDTLEGDQKILVKKFEFTGELVFADNFTT